MFETAVRVFSQSLVLAIHNFSRKLLLAIYRTDDA